MCEIFEHLKTLGIALTATLTLTLIAKADPIASEAYPDDPWTISWASYWATITQDGETGDDGATNKIRAHVLSLERSITDEFGIGIDFTYESQKQEQDTPPVGYSQTGRLVQDGYEANLFAQFNHGPFTIEPNVRFGLDNYKLERPDTITNSGLIGIGKTDGYHLGAYIETSALLPIGGGFFLRPVASYDYEYTTTNSFKETGVVAGPFDFNISYDRIHDHRSIGEIGLGIGAQIPLNEKVKLTPFVIGKYRQNFITGSVSTNAHIGTRSLGELPLSSGQEKHGFLLDVGTIVEGSENVEFWAVYRGQYFPSSTRHGFAGQLNIKF